MTETEDRMCHEGVAFNSLTGFHFSSWLTVKYDDVPIWSDCFELKIRMNKIVLSQGPCEFWIYPIEVDCILINDISNYFEVFICLRNAPTLLVDKQLSRFDFSNKSFNLCLRRNSSIDPAVSWLIRDGLQYFSLAIYNVSNLKRDLSNYRPVADTRERRPSERFMQEYLIKVWHSKYAALLPPVLPQNVLKKFYSCSSMATLELLLNNTVPVRFNALNVQQIRDVELPFADCDPPSNYSMFGRVKITPSRCIFMPMLPLQKNRVFRYYPNPQNFLLISFDDEMAGSNPWRSEIICNYFLEVLHTGLIVGGKRFTFLGCSNSQLREGHCWFSCLNRQDVYDRIGVFPDTMSPGRKLTRLALAFASSTETVPLNYERYLKTVAPDVKTNGINFSDGIGRASPSVFKEIGRIMNLTKKISAFQIRIGGIKGVISLYDGMPADQDVMFRESMKKFESKHNMLEVLNFSMSIPLFLNRHIILLLSTYGVPNEVFLDLQHNALVKCMENLTDDDKALSFVKSNSTIFDWELMPKEIVHEPFFRQLLISNTIQLISGIINHAHVPVPKGRVLMGVLDETNTLNYGEVYAHVVEDKLDMELEGKVVVFRNPCVLPSDVRVLTACSGKYAKLRHLYENCLVLPSRGPDSHANECSGGDLDGDLYYVIWDQNLIPPNLSSPGAKVVEVEMKERKLEKKDFGDSGPHFEMMQFFCDYVSTNQLGIIANAHLAVSDKLGMCANQSIALARYVTAETDAPKKGLTVGKVDPKLMPKEYPDYMQKSDKVTYRSETVLGELFRQAHPLLDVLLAKKIVLPSRQNFDISQASNTIDGMYARYAFDIKKLLQGFELESEVDLFSGTPVWRKGYMSLFKQQNQLRLTVIENMTEFWRKWQDIFEEWRSTNQVQNSQETMLNWYNFPSHQRTPVDSFSFLALPFVDFEEHARKTIVENIHTAALRWINYNKMKWLNEWRHRYHVCQALVQKLEGIECHPYGSSVLGLSEEYSDVDLYAADNNFPHLSKKLKSIDEHVVDLKKPHACVSLSHDLLPVDVTNFIGGVEKTYALAEAFDKNPKLWPALRVLIEWARRVKIVKSGGSEGLMTVVSFAHLLIYYHTEAAPKRATTQKDYALSRFAGWMESLRDSQFGQLIYDFLTFLSTHKNKSWIVTKTDPWSNEPLIKSSLVDELRKNAEIAVYILAVHDGDVNKLFLFCTKTRLFRIDKRYMKPDSVSEGKKEQCLKEIKAKCNPKKSTNLKFELLDRNGVFYLEVTGDHNHFPVVERGLNKIHTKIISSRVSGLRKFKAYHIKNSTLLLPEYGRGRDTQVSFSTYQGENFMAQHTSIWKSVLTFYSNDKNLNWRSDEYKRYEKLFLKQMQLFRDKQHMAEKGSRTWRFFSDMMCNIRCGNHYLFNVPETLNNTFETVYLSQVEGSVAKLEEALNIETQNNIIQDLKNYNSLTLLHSQDELVSNTPLELVPLQAIKKRSTGEKKDAIITATPKKKSSGINHSFYPQWIHGEDKASEFAIKHGFKRDQITDDDDYTTISVYWRQREIVVSCDRKGLIKSIRHRSARWVSATFNRYKPESGDDVRTYLECRAALDDDESCLETVIDYLNGRSVFAAAFSKQIENHAEGHDEETFFSRPLIPEMFHLNWRFRSMRRITTVAKFVNADHDIILLHEIYDGIFRLETREFEWFPKHYELEIRMSTDKRSDIELCKKSFELSLMLFDFTKQNA